MVLKLNGNKLDVVLRDNMVEMQNYRLLYTITENGKVIKKGEIKDLTVPSVKYNADADVRLNISVQLKSDTKWAKAGFEVRHEQFAINDKLSSAFKPAALKTGRQADVKAAEEWFNAVKPHFYRAPMDNDKGFGNWIAKDWKNNRLDNPEVVTVKPLSSKRNADGTVTVAVTQECRYVNGKITADYLYTMDASGSVDFKAVYTQEGQLPPLPCVGNTFVLDKDMTQLSWYGRGLQDSYVDRLEATSIGRWTSSVPQEYVHYPRPQSSGNHEQTVTLSLTTAKGKGYTVTTANGKPFSFSALPYSEAQLSTVAHDCDLQAEDNVYLNIDARMMGLGNSSCGPGVLTKYSVPQEPHTLHLMFTRK